MLGTSSDSSVRMNDVGDADVNEAAGDGDTRYDVGLGFGVGVGPAMADPTSNDCIAIPIAIAISPRAPKQQSQDRRKLHAPCRRKHWIQ